MFCIFFFSSRRRHTRSTRDWSSDVCLPILASRAMRLLWVEVRDFRNHAETVLEVPPGLRSEERRVGKEWRSRWSPCHEKKKKEIMRLIRVEETITTSCKCLMSGTLLA